MKSRIISFAGLFLLFLLLPAAAYAQTKNIDQLTAGTTPNGTELVPVVQGSDPAVKLTLSQIVQALVAISAGCGNTTNGGAIQVGTIASTLPPVSTSSTAYPMTAGANCGGVLYLSNTTAGVPTIPQAGSTGYPLGTMFEVCDIGTGSNTITPAAGTIAGQSSYVLGAGTPTSPTCVGFTSDGVSDYKIIANGAASNPMTAAASSVTGDVVVFSGTSGNVATDQTALQIVSGTGAGVASGNIAVFLKRLRVTPRLATIATDAIFSTSDYFVCAANPTATAWEIMPSSPVSGDTYLIKDCYGTAASHPINILPAAGLIDGASSFVISTAYSSVALTYMGLGWMSN